LTVETKKEVGISFLLLTDRRGACAFISIFVFASVCNLFLYLFFTEQSMVYAASLPMTLMLGAHFFSPLSSSRDRPHKASVCFFHLWVPCQLSRGIFSTLYSCPPSSVLCCLIEKSSRLNFPRPPPGLLFRRGPLLQRI